MSYKVMEEFVASKTGSPLHGEDLIVLCEHFVAVIDGATAVGAVAGQTPSPGRLAADALCRAIQDFPQDLDATHAVAEMSACVREAQRTHGTAMAASLVLYSVARREIWSVGDCQLLCGPVLHSPTLLIDRLLGELRAYVLEYELTQGKSVDTLMEDDRGRAAIEPFLKMQSLFANATTCSAFAYGVINGEDVPERFVHVHAVPPDVHEIVLASDGYPHLKHTLKASEAALAQLLEDDPLRMQSPPATKGLRPGAISYDDRAYVRIRV